MRLLLCTVLSLLLLQANAQRECTTQNYLQQLRELHPEIDANEAAVEAFVQQHLTDYRSARASGSFLPLLRIPVVVHILYNNAAQNITDAQVHSQLEALNRDFRKRNEDTVNTPARFKHLAADVQIEFVLATADPNGRKTTGIVRKQTSVGEWSMDDKIKFSAQGGDNAWDSRSYLNIWVGNMRRLLGYSSAPGGPFEKDGLVINISAFGTVNVPPPYNKGRTAVHELGHWLGLKHIWGDVMCGSDGVDDTPVQGNFTSGCPGGFRTSCSNAPTGDMYMNYMDFTADACMNLFTEGQKARMRALFLTGGARSSLLTSKGLHEPWVEESPLPVEEEPIVAVPTAPKVYPNPAATEISFAIGNDATWMGRKIYLFNLDGKVVQTVVINSSVQKIGLTHLRPGLYVLKGDNGEKKLNYKLVKL